jgi:hypothetical protein
VRCSDNACAVLATRPLAVDRIEVASWFWPRCLAALVGCHAAQRGRLDAPLPFVPSIRSSMGCRRRVGDGNRAIRPPVGCCARSLADFVVGHFRRAKPWTDLDANDRGGRLLRGEHAAAKSHARSQRHGECRGHRLYLVPPAIHAFHDPLGLNDIYLARHGQPAIRFGKEDPTYTLGVVAPSVAIWHAAAHVWHVPKDVLSHYQIRRFGRDVGWQSPLVCIRTDRVLDISPAFADWPVVNGEPPGATPSEAIVR